LALDCLLSDDIRRRSIVIGNERILSYEEALTAGRLAAEQSIAVLGFDAGEVLEDGFQMIDYSGYDCEVMPKPHWYAYVSEMNTKALDWITTHRSGKNHGYILTSTSEQEFYALALREANSQERVSDENSSD
jgi:hypothetical protein